MRRFPTTMLLRVIFLAAILIGLGFPSAMLAAAPKTHAQTSLHGRLMRVDYASDIILVRTNAGNVEVRVLPSTAIVGKNHGNASLIDLHPGQTLDIDVSVSGAQVLAQIIRIH